MRKKFTMLLASLFLCVGAWAQVETGKMYRIKDNTRSKYLTIRSYNGNSGGAYGTVPVLEKSEANNDQVWYLEDAGNSTYYLKSKSEYYLKCRGWCVDALNTGEKSAISLEVSEEAYYLKNGTFYFKVEDIAGDGGTAHPFCDAPSGHANIVTWTFEEVDESEFASAITLKYEFVYGGDVKYTQETTVVAGNEYPNITTSFPYGVTATKPDGTVNAEDATDGVITKQIELTVGELPFVAAETAEGITNWYYMQMHWNNKHYVNAEGTTIEWTDTEVAEGNEDAYTWGFVGNIWDGFKVVNYAAYTEENNENTTLTWNSGTSLTSHASASTFAMVHSAWNGASAESFCLQIPNSTNYLNAQSGIVASWGDADAGSTIILTERPMTEAAELTALIAEIEAAGVVSGTNPGEYTVASVNALNAALVTAKAVQSATADDVTALQDAYDALAVNPINAGKYFIVNAKTDFNDSKVLTTYGVCSWYGTASTPAWTEKNTNDPLQYWEIEVSGETYSLKSAYEGSYITSVSTLGDEPVAASFTWLASGQYNITVGGGVLHANLHSYANTSNIVSYGGGADSPSAWKLVAVTEEPTFTHELTVGDAGWATLMLGYDAVIPADVKAYLVKGLVEGTNEYVQLEQIESVLPANTPVIIEATANKYTFTSTTSSASVEGNLLEGTLYPKNIAEEAYVLGIVNGNVGLYKAELNQENNTAFLNNANKVYLPASALATTAQALRLTRDGETSIDKAQLTIDNVVIYDLTGRRVEKMEKGIYIVNGKKIIK